MDKSSVVTLIQTEQQRDAYGVMRAVETSREVFCQVDSVTRQEFFEGGRNGLNPELRFTLFAYDYDGETVIEYNGQRYGVYRTFVSRTDSVELYAERKGGVNRGSS